MKVRSQIHAVPVPVSNLPANQCCGSGDILVRIRIRGSVPLTSGSDSGSCYFLQWPSRWQKKKKIFQCFFAYYILKLHLYHFSKLKNHKEVTKQQEIRFFLPFLFGNRRIRIRIRIRTWYYRSGSGSSRPKNIQIRIRIRNTAGNVVFRVQGPSGSLSNCNSVGMVL